jgi:hypothetical protein
MKRLIRICLAVLPLAVAWQSLSADASPWDVIADDADVVIRIKAPQRFVKQIRDMADLVREGSGDQIRHHVSLLGEAILNPKLIGVDMQSDWWLAIYASGGDRSPGLVFIIPAIDRQAMQEALPKNVRILEQGAYAVYSADAAAVAKTAARRNGNGKSIASVFDAESRTVFDAADLSVFFNVSNLAKTYQPAIEEGKRQAKLRKQGSGGTGGGANADPIVIELRPNEAVIGVFEDMQSATFAATVSNEAVELRGLVRIRPGTPTAQNLPKSTAEPFTDLDLLPTKSTIYAGAAGDTLLRMKFMPHVGQLDIGDLRNPSRTLSAALPNLQSFKFDSLAYACSNNLWKDDAFIGHEAWIARLREPHSLRKLARQVAAAANGADATQFRWQVDAKAEAERYDQYQADVVTWRQLFRKKADAGPGANKLTTRTVYLDDRVVQTAGADPRTMVAVLAGLVGGKDLQTVDSGFRRTRSRLEPEADLIILLDAPLLIAEAIEVCERAIQNAFNQAFWFLDFLPGRRSSGKTSTGEKLKRSLDESKFAGSYLGLSAVALPDGVRVRIYIPLEQIQGLAMLHQTLSEQADTNSD